jgi:hypothetical protein
MSIVSFPSIDRQKKATSHTTTAFTEKVRHRTDVFAFKIRTSATSFRVNSTEETDRYPKSILESAIRFVLHTQNELLVKPNESSTMSDTIDVDSGLSTQGRSPRFTLWVGFLVFSTITLGSSVEVVSPPITVVQRLLVDSCRVVSCDDLAEST